MLNYFKLKSKTFIPYKFQPLKTTFVLLFILLIALTISLTVTTTNLSVDEYANKIYLNIIKMMLTGVALGISTYILQRISRNRFADVSIMGIGSINLIALSTLAIGVDFSGNDANAVNSVDALQSKEPWIYMSLSVLLMLIYFIVSKQKENFNYKKLIMGGVIFTFFLVAFAQSIRGWLNVHAHEYVVGHVVGTSAIKPNNTIYITSAFICAAIIWLLFNSYRLQMISINQQIAKQLGIKINFHILAAMICIGVLVGSSFALSGDFVYVGLIAGNIAMRKRNNNLGFGIVNAGIMGMIMTIATFWVASMINLKQSHVGALLPLVIGPFFIFKVIRS